MGRPVSVNTTANYQVDAKIIYAEAIKISAPPALHFLTALH
jgi:hypothetical protein